MTEYLSNLITTKLHLTYHLYIDMSKAFDLIEFTILLHMLTYYRIYNSTLKLIINNFIDIKQYCNFKCTSCNILTKSKGVPHGLITFVYYT